MCGLSLRYMKKNPGRTFYSILGIMLSVILCFDVLIVGMALFDGMMQEAKDSYHGCDAGIICLGEDSNMNPERYQEIKKLVDVSDFKDMKLISDKEDGEDELPSYTLYVSLKDPSDLLGYVERFNKKYDGVYYMFTDEFIAWSYGQHDDETLLLFRSVIVIIAAFFACFVLLVIRNTMGISVMERTRDYGLMRCSGMSQKQLTVLLMTEGILMSLVSVALGCAVGFGLLMLVQGWINDKMMLMTDVTLHFRFYPMAVLWSLVICGAVTLFALLEPARQAGKMPACEALRGGNYGIWAPKKRQRIRKRRGFANDIGSLFGVELEYGLLNLKRSASRGLYLFMGVVICVCGVGCILCGVDSAYATFENSMQGKRMRYDQEMAVRTPYDDRFAAKVEQDVRKMKGVTDCSVLYKWQYLDALKVKDGRDNFLIEERGYTRRNLESLQDQIADGSFSYDELQRSDGVILCDYVYNVSDKESDYDQVDRRQTSLQVGDKIWIPQPDAYDRTSDDYQEALQKSGYGNKVGDPSPEEERNYIRKMCRLLEKKGYELNTRELCEQGEDYSILVALREHLKKKGMGHEYTIRAVIKEDVLGGPCAGVPGIVLIMPEKNLVRQGSGIYWGIGFNRTVSRSGTDMAKYCRKLEEQGIDVTVGYYDMDGGFVEDSPVNGPPADTVAVYSQRLQAVQKSGLFVCIFIGIICLIQLYNTLEANMLMRRREHRLMRAVGMSRRQMGRMIRFECTFLCLFGALTGLGISGLGCWFVIEKILNMDGSIFFSWPWPAVGASCVVVWILCIAVGHLAVRNGQNMVKDSQK